MQKLKLKNEKITAFAEGLFLTLVGVYLFMSAADTSSFRFTFPENFEKYLLIAIAAVSSVLFISRIDGIGQYFLATAVMLVYGAVYLFTGYISVLFFAFFTIGCTGIKYRKLLWTYLITVGILWAVGIIASLGGVVENLAYHTTDGIRNSFGIGYPTDFAAYAFYLLCYIWILDGIVPEWMFLVVVLFSRAILYQLTISDTANICLMVFAFVLFYYFWERKTLGKVKIIKKTVNLFLEYAWLFFAAVTFVMIHGYSEGIPLFVRLNSFLSSRNDLALRGIRNYGLPLFGQKVDFYGFGFMSTPGVDYAEYNFVDSSYPLILIKYGILVFILMSAVWITLSRKAIKAENRRLAMVTAMIALHSVSEHHFPELFYNILLILPFADLSNKPRMTAEKLGKKRLAVSYAVFLSVLAVLLIASPAVIRYEEILYTYLSQFGPRQVLFFVCIAVMFLAVALFTVSLPGFLCPDGRKERISCGIRTAVSFGIIAAAVVKACMMVASIPAWDTFG